MAKEMKESREAQLKPHIEITLVNADLFNVVLRIANIGPGLAYNPYIRFGINDTKSYVRQHKPLLFLSGEFIDFKIPTGPNKDDVETNISKLAEKLIVLNVVVTYNDIFKKNYSIPKKIDLKEFAAGIESARYLLPYNTLGNIVSELAVIKSSLERFVEKFYEINK
jgi:hypothetical protein